jgi:hypothetical protein
VHEIKAASKITSSKHTYELSAMPYAYTVLEMEVNIYNLIDFGPETPPPCRRRYKSDDRSRLQRLTGASSNEVHVDSVRTHLDHYLRSSVYYLGISCPKSTNLIREGAVASCLAVRPFHSRNSLRQLFPWHLPQDLRNHPAIQKR